MSVYQNLNQLAETPVKGMLAGIVNPATISAQIYDGSTNTLVAGDLVDFVAVKGNMIIVDKAVGGSTGSLGFVVYSPKKNKYTAGDAIEVAMSNSVIYLESAGAIQRGHPVEFVATGSLVKSALWVNPCVGRALDIATAANQLVRVLVGLEPTESESSSSSSSSCRSSSSSSSSCRSSSSSSRSSSSSSCRSSSSSSSRSSSSSMSSSSSSTSV